MRTKTSAAGLLLLAALLTGCSNGEDSATTPGDDAAEDASAPADAAQGEFCDAYAGLFKQMGQMDPQDNQQIIRGMKEWAADMKDVGTPEDIPDEAREGFEVMLGSIEEVDEEATQEELDALGDDLTDGEQKAGDAFVDYANETCPDALQDMLGEMEQDMEDQLGELEDEMGELGEQESPS